MPQRFPPSRAAVRWIDCALLAVFLATRGQTAGAQEAGPELYRSLQAESRVRVVVALAEPTLPRSALSRAAEIRRIQDGVLSRLTREEFALSHRWSSINGFAGELNRDGLDKLLADPSVVRVDLDVEGRGGLVESSVLIGANLVQAMGFTGLGVAVAVLDSGVERAHPDLRNSLLDEQCFCTNSDGTGCCPDGATDQSGPGAAIDDHGHGTHVTGIITGDGGVAPRGIAPEAQIVAVKVLDRENRFAASAQVISGLDWVLNRRPDVRVVNLSLGTRALFGGHCDRQTSFTMAFAAAINALKDRATVVFANSGNDQSSSQLEAPACVQSAVSVAAVYDGNVGPVSVLGCSDPSSAADRVPCFANTSDTLDLLAPGAPIRATGLGGRTSTYYGTSQATAHASAAAAVLLELDPRLNPDEIIAALKLTGVPVADPRNGLVFPRLDLLGAVNWLGVR